MPSKKSKKKVISTITDQSGDKKQAGSDKKSPSEKKPQEKK